MFSCTFLRLLRHQGEILHCSEVGLERWHSEHGHFARQKVRSTMSLQRDQNSVNYLCVSLLDRTWEYGKVKASATFVWSLHVKRFDRFEDRGAYECRKGSLSHIFSSVKIGQPQHWTFQMKSLHPWCCPDDKHQTDAQVLCLQLCRP